MRVRPPQGPYASAGPMLSEKVKEPLFPGTARSCARISMTLSLRRMRRCWNGRQAGLSYRCPKGRAGSNPALRTIFPFLPRARVMERQTSRPQLPVSERTCGFKSRPAHHFSLSPPCAGDGTADKPVRVTGVRKDVRVQIPPCAPSVQVMEQAYIPALDTGSCGFDSRPVHLHTPLAQQAEHLTFNQGVMGPNPIGRTETPETITVSGVIRIRSA